MRPELDVERWTVRFPPGDPAFISCRTLKQSYCAKPLVYPFGVGLFGELAILRCLERDGWSGVWVDSYHGTELFWRGLPHESSPVDLEIEPRALDTYRGIVREHGKRGGFFDVFAWNNDGFIFIEYKGKGDRPNSNELSWIDAALRYGVHPTQLLFAEYASKRK